MKQRAIYCAAENQEIVDYSRFQETERARVAAEYQARELAAVMEQTLQVLARASSRVPFCLTFLVYRPMQEMRRKDEENSKLRSELELSRKENIEIRNELCTIKDFGGGQAHLKYNSSAVDDNKVEHDHPAKCQNSQVDNSLGAVQTGAAVAAAAYKSVRRSRNTCCLSPLDQTDQNDGI